MTPKICLQVIPRRLRPRQLGGVAQWLFIVLWVGLAAQISLNLQADTLIAEFRELRPSLAQLLSQISSYLALESLPRRTIADER